MYQNYIFDLYGTLIDIHTDESSKNFYKKYVKWLRKQGYYFDWKQFRSSFLRIEQQYRSQPSKHHNSEIQMEDVFQDVFREKGWQTYLSSVQCAEKLHLAGTGDKWDPSLF